MSSKGQGGWCLVAACDDVPNVNQLKKQHEDAQKKKQKQKRPFPTSTCAFILWKDRKLVIFYTNDLAHTPSKDILDDTNEERVCCVNSLGPLRCWVGNAKLNCAPSSYINCCLQYFYELS